MKTLHYKRKQICRNNNIDSTLEINWNKGDSCWLFWLADYLMEAVFVCWSSAVPGTAFQQHMREDTDTTAQILTCPAISCKLESIFVCIAFLYHLYSTVNCSEAESNGSLPVEHHVLCIIAVPFHEHLEQQQTSFPCLVSVRKTALLRDFIVFN